MDNRYSVLISVYNKEQPKYFRAALNSIFCQTLQPDEVVLVCDGPLTEDLENVIADYQGRLKLVRLRENQGLGQALAQGLNLCQNEWVARMDSDDIADNKRCEKQMEYIKRHPEIDVLSGAVAEFTGDAETEEEAEKYVYTQRKVPLEHDKILEYIKYRNPVNHPCVMFRKSKVMSSGNYCSCDLFEDYDLWVRMCQNHCIFANLSDVILFMRTNDLSKHRGGLRYAKAIIRFYGQMYHRDMLTLLEYIGIMTSRVIVSMFPNCIRTIIYNKALRKR